VKEAGRRQKKRQDNYSQKEQPSYLFSQIFIIVSQNKDFRIFRSGDYRDLVYLTD